MGMMLYPKTQTKKKRKAHKDSILHRKDGTCYLCMKLHDDDSYHEVLQEHHIFGDSDRDHSEAEGLKVYLCLSHHTYGAEAVHQNARIRKMVWEDGQRAFEQEHTREEFMRIFGKNYIMED